MKLIDTILAGFGGEGNARASLPAGSQYNPEQTNWDREKQRKGGPDKGGVTAGGPGSGRHKEGDRVVRNYKMQKQWRDSPQMRDYNHGTVISVVKDGVRMRNDADTKILKDPNADKWDKASAEKGTFYQHNELLPEVKSAAKTKTLTSDAAGSQSEGSSKTARSYRVTDGMGRVLHKFKTKEEAQEASVGNRYTRVVSQIPPDEATEVRDMIRKRPGGNNKVKVFRKSLPYGATMFPQGPTSR